MAYKISFNSFMHHAFFNSYCDFFTDYSVLSFIGSVHGSIADCQRIYTCLFEKLNCLQWICISTCCCKYMIFYTCQHTKFSFYRNASLMCIFYNFTCKFYILLKLKRTSIDHNTCVTTLNSCHTGIKIASVIQMQGNRNLTVCSVFLYRIRDIFGSDFFVLQSCICKICTSSHKSIGKVCSLQDSRASEHFMDIDHCFCLAYSIYVKCPLRIIILVRCVQNYSHWY